MAQLLKIDFKITKGMNQDVDPQSSNLSQAFKLYNLKTLILDSSVLNDLTNEKGNSIIVDNDNNIVSITGKVIGIIPCTNEVVVLFIYKSSTVLSIYRLTYDEDSNTLNYKLLAEGDFNIPDNVDISGIFVHENSEILKIFWVDTVNLLRYLNISDSNPYYENGGIVTDYNLLNSKPKFNLNHKITVTRKSGGGAFTAGVILYVLTYFNKYGAETNIVDITPLYYIAEDTRGLAADEVTGCSFEIKIENPDSEHFDYMRIYSILRTSLDGLAIVKIVGDIKLR